MDSQSQRRPARPDADASMEMLEKESAGGGRGARRLWVLLAVIAVVAAGAEAVSRLDDRPVADASPRAKATDDPAPTEVHPPVDRGPEPEPETEAGLPAGWQPFIVGLLEQARREPSWTGSVLTATAGRLTLYLKGSPSSTLGVRAAGAPAGLRVVFRESPYSLAELERARDDLIGRDPRIASVSIPESGSALLVGLAPAAFPAGLGPTDRGEVSRALGSEVPLILYVDEEPTNVS